MSSLDKYRDAGFTIDETNLDAGPGYRASARLVSLTGHSSMHEIGVATDEAGIIRRIELWLADHPNHESATVSGLKGVGSA